MDAIKGKYFSITDPQGVNTVIYKVNQTEKEISENAPKFTVERLDNLNPVKVLRKKCHSNTSYFYWRNCSYFEIL